jgi:hypothetical protein
VRIRLTTRAAVPAFVALGMLVSGTGVANAAGHGDGKTNLRLVAEELQSEFLDLGTPGPSLGDELVFSEALSQRGREVGTSGVVCTITQAVAPYDVLTFQCVGTLSLERGQITLQGLIEVQGEDDAGPFVVAITGGTGKYRGAGGQAKVRDVGDTTIYKLRFDSGKKNRGNKKQSPR